MNGTIFICPYCGAANSYYERWTTVCQHNTRSGAHHPASMLLKEVEFVVRQAVKPLLVDQHGLGLQVVDPDLGTVEYATTRLTHQRLVLGFHLGRPRLFREKDPDLEMLRLDDPEAQWVTDATKTFLACYNFMEVRLTKPLDQQVT